LQGSQEYLIQTKNIKDKGNIARIYLYMIDRYNLKVEDSLRDLCLTWHHQYPVSPWEKEKNRKIFKLQGTFNPYIEKL